MKIERVAWFLVVLLLAAALVTVYLKYDSLKRSVLAGKSERALASSVLALFSKEQDVDTVRIRNDFYLVYVGLSDRSCISMVPKPEVYGGATTYCFTKKPPTRLLTIDHESE